MTKKRVRLIDIAKKANISRAAVARVLIGTGAGRIRVGKEKAELIRKLADEMNFRPDNSAQMLAGKRSKIIGVLIDSYAPQVRFKTLSVTEQLLAKEGFRLIVGQTHDNYNNFKSYINDFAARRVDAVICFAHEYPNFDVSKDFESFENVVFVGKPKLPNANYVAVDMATGTRDLVQHLIDKGRKKIGLWSYASGNISTSLREQYYIEELKKQNLCFTPQMIAYSNKDIPEKQDCLDVIDKLVKEQKVDAIIANNDIWALKLIKYMKKAQLKVPQDVAVTGFDNLDIAEIYDPELTTVDQHSEKQGEIIAEIVKEIITQNKKEKPRQIIIKPELVIREST